MRAQSGAAKVPCLIIVARNQLDLWRALARHFARDMKVQVILDRRQRERRQQPRGYEPDRRRTDRRRPPTVEQDLPSRAFVIVRQHLESA